MNKTNPDDERPTDERQSQERELAAAIAAIAGVQAAELLRALAAEQETWPIKGVPNAMQLVHRDGGIGFFYGEEVALPVNVDGEAKTLAGAELIKTLAGKSVIALPKQSPFSHFTFIEGGQVTLNGVVTPHMRHALAWDLHHTLSYIAASKEPLPYPHKLATTFQQFHVRCIIERLGINRGPRGRKDRLRQARREAKQGAQDNYHDEVSGSSSLLTGEEDFWRGVSPAVPPWRFLLVEGQDAERTRHEGNDTLPGHLAERVLTDMQERYGMVVQRRGDPVTGKRRRERIFSETELVGSQMRGAEWRGEETSDKNWGLDTLPDHADDPESAAITNEIFDRLRAVPGFDVWNMDRLELVPQKEIAEIFGHSQSWVSRTADKAEEEIRRIAVEYRK